MSAPPEPVAPTLTSAAVNGLCPRFGAKTLFVGFATFALKCPSCGLDFSQFNVGDGPAAFLTLIIGTVIVAMAIALELTMHPPLWLHMAIWTPITALAVLGSLRVCKAWLLAAEYRNNAREGRKL